MRHSWVSRLVLITLAGLFLLAMIPVSRRTPGTQRPPTDSRTRRSVVLRGKVFYNDLRRGGRWDFRRTPDGQPGRQCVHGTVCASSGRECQNDLALVDATVTVYEIDRVSGPPGCIPSTAVGTATVGLNGAWRWDGVATDTCAADDGLEGAAGVSLAAKVTLRYCNATRCFSVRDPGDEQDGPNYREMESLVWGLWTGLSDSSPRVVRTDGEHDAGSFTFETRPNGTRGDPRDLAAQAANLFASLSDVTMVWHQGYGVPLDPRNQRLDEPHVLFPSNHRGVPHTHEEGVRICIQAPGAPTESPRAATGWINGEAVMHEYGHIVHFRAWEGHGDNVDYGRDPCAEQCDDNPDCGGWVGCTRETPGAALKEGWANFFARVVAEQQPASVYTDGTNPNGCATDASFDTTGVVGNGDAEANGDYPTNFTHALCDILDARVDMTRPPTSDEWSEAGGPRALWEALRDTWDRAPQSAKNDCRVHVGSPFCNLRPCDYIAAYIARAGGHPSVRQRIENLTRTNAFRCPSP